VRSFCNYDPFAEAAGARLAKASQRRCLFAWRRFLGFLTSHEPAALEDAPGERLTIERIRAFVSDLAKTNAPTSVASVVGGLYQGARFMIPGSRLGVAEERQIAVARGGPRKNISGPCDYKRATAGPRAEIDG
jgi:hypothetical protein